MDGNTQGAQSINGSDLPTGTPATRLPPKAPPPAIAEYRSDSGARALISPKAPPTSIASATSNLSVPVLTHEFRLPRENLENRSDSGARVMTPPLKAPPFTRSYSSTQVPAREFRLPTRMPDAEPPPKAPPRFRCACACGILARKPCERHVYQRNAVCVRCTQVTYAGRLGEICQCPCRECAY